MDGKNSCETFYVAPSSTHYCAESLLVVASRLPRGSPSTLASVPASQAQATPDVNQNEVDSKSGVLTAGELKIRKRDVYCGDVFIDRVG